MSYHSYKYSYNVRPFVNHIYHHSSHSGGLGIVMWTIAFEYDVSVEMASRLELNLGWVVA